MKFLEYSLIENFFKLSVVASVIVALLCPDLSYAASPCWGSIYIPTDCTSPLGDPVATHFFASGSSYPHWDTGSSYYYRLIDPLGNSYLSNLLDGAWSTSDGMKFGSGFYFDSNHAVEFGSDPIDWSLDGLWSYELTSIYGGTAVLSANITQGGGGGAGGGASSTLSIATSTVDQAEQNLFFAYWTFFASLVFVVWLIRSKR
jgi:hypothetical protein